MAAPRGRIAPAPAAGDIAIVMREQDVRVDAKSPRKRAMRDKRA